MNFTGLLELNAKKSDHRSIVNSYYEGALKITRPIYLEEKTPSIYLIHIGGGYVDGDTYYSKLKVEEGAELLVTSQASTKVYQTPKVPVEQHTEIELAKNSTLEYIMDPLIMYKGARFIQKTSVNMGEGASLFYSDIITPGWAENGKGFQYDWIRSKLKVKKNNKLVLFDHLWVEPDGEIQGIMQLEGYTHLGTFIIIHGKADKTFTDQLYEELVPFSGETRFGISTLTAGGVVIRILANGSRKIEELISQAHRFARNTLLGKEQVYWRK